ncbi:UNVERIFIED_CONTAM: hypothetical protein K2H54_063310 [Gekko kuhli]
MCGSTQASPSVFESSVSVVFPYQMYLHRAMASLGQHAYKRKTEAAKKEYLKALAAYRASLVSKVTDYVS